MISEEMILREEKCRRICRHMTAAYIAVGAALAAGYAVMGEWYLAAQSLGTIAALLAIFVVMRLARIRPVYSLQAVIIAFTFAAYTLGVACAFYKIIPGYDKLLHMLSGTMTMMLALPLFYVFKPGHRVEKSDFSLAAAYCLAVSLAVAGVWEIAEYALSLIADMDPQCVQATGVADTMRDMIVCALGALITLPALNAFYRNGQGGWLFGAAEVFVQKNLMERV